MPKRQGSPKSQRDQATRNARARVHADVLRSMGVDVPNVGPGTIRRIRRELSNDLLTEANIRYEAATNRSLPKSAPHNKGQSKFVTKIKGGDMITAPTATDVRARLVRLGDTPVALSIDFDGEPRFASVKSTRMSLAGDLQASRGESGRDGESLEDHVVIYAPHPDGFRASDILRLADQYRSMNDALFSLWLSADPSGSPQAGKHGR